mgnify:CR=1 FL=1
MIEIAANEQGLTAVSFCAAATQACSEQPLLLAGTWLHLGKGTVFGLGQPAVEPLD